jgi:anti-sigma regulatory factor (Ser/Thr protein kinase)
VGLELGLRGAKAMIVHSPPGGPYYQAPGALGTFDGIWHAQAPPCVTIRTEDSRKLHPGERVKVVLRAPLSRGAKALNVVGLLPGRQRGEPLVVAGHHDGWFGAAFDDASGVAVTLELARAIREARIRPERSLAFVSHTAEEYGVAASAYDWCYGAWYQVVEEHREWTTSVPFYLNVEGSGRPDPLTVDAPPELAAWARRHCRRAAADGLLPHGWKLGAPNTWTEVWPFLAAGIPGINVSTFTSGFDRTEYHTQFDTADGVDFDYLARLTTLFGRLLLDPPRPDFEARARHLRAALDGRVPAKLERALKMLDEGVELKRRVIEELRPTLLDNLGLAAAVDWQVRQTCERAGLKCSLNLADIEQDMPPEITIALYRIIQEALTNVVKHAGARKVSILLVRRDGSVTTVIEDDGAGFDVVATREDGLGLLGMRERVAILDGRLTIESSPGQGTTIVAEVPIA